MPDVFAGNYAGPGGGWGWHSLFPADRIGVGPADRKARRYDVYEETLQAALRRVVRRAGITKRASAHTLRHSFASRLQMNGSTIREVLQLLGHRSVETAMVYTHVVREVKAKARSPPPTPCRQSRERVRSPRWHRSHSSLLAGLKDPQVRLK